ncbi:MAG TPA: nucleoside triphosphate pyrophosphohydrolase [Steroidobacteraceae bacterium]|nr:nucleoside triphosphate pyrophosphohydrolase [Steroidobacteraceae bacterium]
MSARVLELLAIMERLRAPDGCPWDRQQTFASIAPYTIEEAYEVADAIDRGDPGDLKEELGDLLFQVVFHSQMARERQEFDFEAVAGAICEKLVRRHPHVFGERRPLTAPEQSAVWEDIKARERSGGAANGIDGEDTGTGGAQKASVSALDGVPRSLPALMRAYKLSKRAARVGFDWEHAGQTADKVAEELAEIRAAAETAAASSPEIFEEVGDLLFAAANLARKLDVDAEAALRAANAKFERRFRAMEELARQHGQTFASLDLAAQEKLWLEVKRAE